MFIDYFLMVFALAIVLIVLFWFVYIVCIGLSFRLLHLFFLGKNNIYNEDFWPNGNPKGLIIGVCGAGFGNITAMSIKTKLFFSSCAIISNTTGDGEFALWNDHITYRFFLSNNDVYYDDIEYIYFSDKIYTKYKRGISFNNEGPSILVDKFLSINFKGSKFVFNIIINNEKILKQVIDIFNSKGCNLSNEVLNILK